MTIGNPAFCLVLNLTDVHFRGESQHVGDIDEQKNVSTNQYSINRWHQILSRIIYFIQQVFVWVV